MKLGISTMIFERTGIPITESINRIGTLGIKFADIAVTGSADPRTMGPKDLENLLSILRAQKISVSGLVLLEAKNIATSNQTYRQEQMDYCKQAIDFGSTIGAQHGLVCWGCGSFELGLTRHQSWTNSRDFLAELAAWAAENHPQIKILLEFDPAVFYILNSTRAMEKMMSELNLPNVFANIDIAHMNVTRENPTALRKLQGRILHVHISDNDGSDDAHIALGRGNIELAPYFRELETLATEQACKFHDIEYVVTLELGEKKESNPDRAVADSLKYLADRNFQFT